MAKESITDSTPHSMVTIGVKLTEKHPDGRVIGHLYLYDKQEMCHLLYADEWARFLWSLAHSPYIDLKVKNVEFLDVPFDIERIVFADGRPDFRKPYMRDKEMSCGEISENKANETRDAEAWTSL